MRSRCLYFLAIALASYACGDDGAAADLDAGTSRDGGSDAAVIDAGVVDAALDANLGPDADIYNPLTLAETGLYTSGEQLAPGVLEFTLHTQLWTDAATKRRWIQLPAGSTIDTSDMDFWVYPEGTKIWKEFTRDGVRVETRLLWKQGPGSDSWFTMPYVWNEQQTSALATPAGVIDAKGTGHDVPSVATCQDCHGRMPDTILGFSAMLLNHEMPGVTLSTLVAANMLSHPPAGVAPYFTPPGTATDTSALRYFHVNCGGCHHDESPLMPQIPLNLRLYADKLTGVPTTPTYLTTVNVTPVKTVNGEMPAIIVPGDAESSNIHIRMNALDLNRMPAVGTEVVDTDGVLIVDAWINSLP